MRRRGLAVLVAAAALVWSAVAEADPGERVAFEWLREAGAEDCADGPELSRRVEERLGRTVFVQRATTVVTGHVVRAHTAPRWRATLALASGTESSGDREITSNAATCRPLESAVVLFLALLLDERAAGTPPEAAAAPAPPTPPAPPPPPPAPPPASPSEPTAAPAPPSSPRAASSTARSTAARAPSSAVRSRARVAATWGSTISAGPVASVGILPALAGGVRGGARLRSPWSIDLELEVIALAAQDLSHGNARHTFSLLAGGAALCHSFLRVGRIDGGGCAGLRLGSIGFSASGYTAENGSGSRAFGELFARPWLSVQVWRWLRAGASLWGGVNLAEDDAPFFGTFRDPVTGEEKTETIYEPSRVNGGGELFLAVQIP